MKSILIFFGLVCCFFTGCASLPATQQIDSKSAAQCRHDRTALLALSQNAFDQDMNGGWRLLARDARCHGVAADLIRDYRIARNLQASILFWHEGQLRANMGATADAIVLFEQSRLQDNDRIGWNYYVAATVAFLQKDRAALSQARESLATLPRPENFNFRQQDGTLMDWPVNLKVVDGLIKCFGLSYGEGYGTKCRN